jgi:hypothetical protein
VPLWFHLTKDEALLRKTNIEGTANIVNFVSTKVKNYATLARQLHLAT